MFSRVASLSLRSLCSRKRSLFTLPVANYQSQYSIDKLYPNSKCDFSNPPSLKHTQAEGEAFNGYIPIDDLDIKCSRSSGPGGQNVNKVSTKVQVRFHVQSADWIPNFAKEKLLVNERGRITKDGYLIVSSEKTRKQMLNQADCIDKVRSMIWRACVLPKEPSPEELELKAKREMNAKQGILREKRSKSLKKQFRRGPGIDSS